MAGVLKNGAIWTQAHREDAHVKQRQRETGAIQARAKESAGAGSQEGGEGVHLWTLRGGAACRHVDPGLLASRLRG